MKKMILLYWRIFDPIYFFFSNLNYIRYGENIFRVRVTVYKGRTLQLADGTIINKNDILLKIHLHNAKVISTLYSIQNDFKKGKMFYHMVKQSLPDLANYLHNHPKQEHIKGLIGVTSLNLGKNHLGFEYFEIKNKYYKIFKFLAFLPINLLSSGLRKQGQFIPNYIAMSKNRLLTTYLHTENEKTITIKNHIFI